MKSLVAIALICHALIQHLTAQSFEIASLRGNGALTFNQITNAAGYVIERAPAVTGPWYTNWAGLELVTPTTNDPVTVLVPMFFRVKALINPPPQNLVISSASHNNTIDGETRGSYNNTHDGDTNTLYGAYRQHGGDGSVDCSITSEHTWPTPSHVSSVRVKMSSHPFPHGNYPRHQTIFEIWLRVNGTWTKEYSEDSGDINGGGSLTERDITLSAGWNAVTGIRAYVYTMGYSYEGDRQQEVWASVYEVMAWGN